LWGKHMSNRRSLRVLNESAPAHMVVTLSASEVKDLNRTKQGFFAFAAGAGKMTDPLFDALNSCCFPLRGRCGILILELGCGWAFPEPVHGLEYGRATSVGTGPV
jgi:hypothetical protein